MGDGRDRNGGQQLRHTREFEAFVAGAGGRLLHAATLLTAETPARNPRAHALLTASLAHTYAHWDRLRGEDPYDRTRTDLAARFARAAWRHHRGHGGVLSRLTPQERLIVVLRVYEGVAEEQTAAMLGLPTERVRAVCARSVAALRRTAPPPSASAQDRAAS
ncbi:sigma factor-like helix-turn-helix DNA-binding protein [Streptomyces sp. HUAS YS2]|uniref:Sigma factor-like helix-turn-helix DNA-binding protein n=1 Tax=Streptomyces solicathayae TaxID=3081768 RepID=A0ABZ0LSF8_9ACTN|nr:sigma factor-like helix-turn-helix DNA-binding protein [Streptomyces sp. HUAS YS2]WOX22422.1 sigma factor-like helix-turn-helix DNA-binding protein [Streptomyces sp. HUAS YS2]